MRVLALLILLAAPAAASPRIPDALDAMAADGFKAMYRHDYLKGEERFTAMTTAMPAHPSGYIFLASLYWWQYSNDFETPNPELEKKFFASARKGIEVADKWNSGKGRNLEAEFWLGGAYGLIGRWHVSQFEWIRAYFNGKKGYQYLKKVYKADPNNHDAALGAGEFEYLASRLPGMVRLTALLFVQGDRDGGIRACIEAAEKGTFTKSEAKLFLTVIYNEHLFDFEAAMKWIDSLVQDDPDNNFFHMMRGLVLMYKGDYAESSKEIEAIIKFLEAHPKDTLRDILSMGYYHMGMNALLEGRHDDAIAWFTKGVEEPQFPQKGWVTNSLLRRGQTFDILGRRKEALADYSRTIERQNFWDTRKFAKEAKNRPAKLEDVKLQVFGEKGASFDK